MGTRWHVYGSIRRNRRSKNYTKRMRKTKMRMLNTRDGLFLGEIVYFGIRKDRAVAPRLTVRRFICIVSPLSIFCDIRPPGALSLIGVFARSHVDHLVFFRNRSDRWISTVAYASVEGFGVDLFYVRYLFVGGGRECLRRARRLRSKIHAPIMFNLSPYPALVSDYQQ